MRTVTAAMAALAVWTTAGGALAQVNAEALRPNPLRPGYSVGFDGMFALARGNIELFDIGVAGRIQYQTLHPVPAGAGGATLPFMAQRVFLVGSGRFAEKAGSPFISQSYLHARWAGMWHPRVGTDVFVQFQYNRFFRLERRGLAGAGVRVAMVNEPTFLMWGGSAYMFEYERIDVAPGAPDAPETRDHRWTSYLTTRLSLWKDRFLLQNTVYYQPRWDDFGDFRLLDELEAQAKVTDIVSFGVTLGVLHDNAPPTGVRPTDLRLGSTIKLSL